MSSEGKHDPESSLCRHEFADGRHCALPAYPNYVGLCPAHFNALNRAPNSKDPARQLSPVSWKHLYEADDLQVLANLPGAVESQAISPEKAATMNSIGNALISSLREMKAEALRKGTVPNWDAIREPLEDCDVHAAPDS